MSLLEDVFLEDEAGEAQELERVIEGDEFEERPRSDSDDNSEKEGEAEEDKKRVDPTQGKPKRVVKNPRFILNPARLTGPRGIQVIPDHFKDFKFKGKGHEKEDLDLVLKKLEHWAYRLYPKFKFEDCLKKIETLGKKRPVMVHLHKIRSDQFISEEIVVQKDSSEDEAPPQEEDEFDKLLQQQIELARATPAPGSVKKGFMTPAGDKRSQFLPPKATSSPSISDEQRERMLRNRQLAEERRLARLRNNTSSQNNTTSTVTIIEERDENDSDNEKYKDKDDALDEAMIVKKVNRSNVITSDDEDDLTNDKTKGNQTNEPIDVDEAEKSRTKRSNVSFLNDMDYDNSNPLIIDESRDSNEVVDISEGYEIRSKIDKENVKVGPVIDLVNAQESEIIISRPNRSNVIDSSDDSDVECALTSVNQSVTVDIHNDNKYSQIETAKSTEVSKETNVSTELIDEENNDIDKHDAISKNTEVLDQSKDMSEDLEDDIEKVVAVGSNSTNMELNDCITSKNTEILDVSNNISDQLLEDNIKVQEKDPETINKDKIKQKDVDKENVDANVLLSTEVEDLMDVDFSDDF